MFENIKSNFFMIYLFSLMEDRKQLHLVKYNKSFSKYINYKYYEL